MCSGITFISLSLLLVHILSWHYEGSFFWEMLMITFWIMVPLACRIGDEPVVIKVANVIMIKGWVRIRMEYMNLPLDPGPL